MNDIENIYIPYLRTGYSNNTVEGLLSDMKIYDSVDHETIQNKALEILNAQNSAISSRNANRNFIVKILDVVLRIVTLGYFRLLERGIDVPKLMVTAGKIHDYVLATPLIEQITRKDYPEVCAKIKLEEEEKEKEREKLNQELKKRSTDRIAAEERLKLLLEKQVKAKKTAEEKGELAPTGTELTDIQKQIRESQEEEKKIRKDIKRTSQTEEQIKIKVIKSAWLDNADAELKRLEAKKIATSATPNNNSNSYSYGYGNTYTSPKVRAAIGRVQEIKQMYGDTHYVFTHGQGKGLSVINECMHQLLKHFTPDLYNPLSQPFRLPFTVDLTKNVTEFFKKYPAVNKMDFNDDNLNKTTGELLSVDTYLWNQQGQESALYFFAQGTNINMSNPNIGFEIFKNIFINYLRDNNLCEILGKKAAEIATDHRKACTLGTLWAICIPKTIVENPDKNMAYLSHAFGRKCNCHGDDKVLDVLRRTQKGEKVPCRGGLDPQYRLLTARLVEEPGVRSFPVNELTKADNKAYSLRIKNLMRELAFYAKLIELTNEPSADETAQLQKEFGDLHQLNQIDIDCLEYLLTIKVDVVPKELSETIQAVILAATPEEKFAFH